MSIILSSPELNAALADIPITFRERIIETYLELKHRYYKSQYALDYDSSGVSSGKFCETILRFLQEILTNTHIPFGQHIKNFSLEAENLSKIDKSKGNESIRILIPKAIILIYTIRNKRGIGHVGGDVEANGIDAATIVRLADWVICELIRVYHKLSLEEAQNIVDAVSQKSLPDIWEVGGKKRILRKDLDFKQKALLLTYSEAESGVSIEDLFSWTEYSSLSMFKRNIILPLHKNKMIEFDTETNYISISPLGIKEVEDVIILKSKVQK